MSAPDRPPSVGRLTDAEDGVRPASPAWPASRRDSDDEVVGETEDSLVGWWADERARGHAVGGVGEVARAVGDGDVELPGGVAAVRCSPAPS